MARTGRGATQDFVRKHNLATLLGHLHRFGPTSRARLTRLLGLNRATIGYLVDDLVARGLVEERPETEQAARGRPSKVVAARSDQCQVLAVQVGVDSVDLALVGLGGTIVGRRRAAVSRPSDRAVEHVVRTVGRLSGHLLELATGTVVGVGVAVPGSVSPSGELVNFAPNLPWREVPLGQLLAERLGQGPRVRVGNDANLGAMAEHSRGVGLHSDDLIYLHAEVGVGGGVITGGATLEGARGYAGEVGHMQVNPSGLACHCGSRGCWETEVGEDALVRRVGMPPGGRSKVELVLRRARAGDPTCLAAVETTAQWISVGLATMVATLDPEMIILGGVFEEILELAQPTLMERLRRSAGYFHPDGVKLVRPRFGRSAVLLGAAELGFQGVLSDPTLMPTLAPEPLDLAVMEGVQPAGGDRPTTVPTGRASARGRARAIGQGIGDLDLEPAGSESA